MKRIAPIVLALSLFAAGSAHGEVFTFSTLASGAQEIQPPGGVDTDTSAELRVRFAEDLSSFRFDLDVFDGRLITQAHLHCAPAGSNGPIIVFLAAIADSVAGPGGEDVDGNLTSGELTNADLEETDFAAVETCGVVINNVASLRAAVEAGLVYLNVHSEFNAPGEVRGQLLPSDGSRRSRSLGRRRGFADD